MVLYEMGDKTVPALEYMKSVSFFTHFEVLFVHFSILDNLELVKNKMRQQISSYLGETRINFSLHVQEGTVEDSLRNFLEEEGAYGTLFVADSFKFGDKVTGSRAGRIIHNTNSWFLVVPPHCLTRAMSKIMVPLEMKEGADMKMDIAMFVAQKVEGEIHLVVPSELDFQPDENFVKAALDRVMEAGIPCSLHAIESQQGFTSGIKELVRSKGIDLVVVQQRPSKKAWYGNDYTEYMLRNKESIPVLVANVDFMNKLVRRTSN